MVKKQMSRKSTNQEKSEKDFGTLIRDLKKYDNMKYSWEQEEQLKKIRNKIISIGEPAVLPMIEILKNHDDPSWRSASIILGEIGDERAIMPLINALEDIDLGHVANEALVKIGPACIPEVIKKVEYRIENPIKEGRGLDHITGSALCTIGEIRCEESIEFLNDLLDDYMSEMPDEAFDPTKRDWKYVNIDFFHILESMVRQQDKRAIPHIEKARDFFPENYTDYKVCQIAIGRIKKGHVEGFLPLEVLDIAMPMGALMNLFSGGKIGYKDNFDEMYGEYFEDDDDLEIKKSVKKKKKGKNIKRGKSNEKNFE